MSSWFSFGGSSAPSTGLILPELETPKTDAERQEFVTRNLERGRALLGSAEWKTIEQPDGSVTTEELPLEAGQELPTMKVSGIVAATPDQIITVLYSNDLPLVQQFDDLCIEIHDIEKFGDSLTIQRRVSNAPFPMSNREAVVLRSITKDGDKIEVLVASINVESLPEPSGIVRGTVWSYIVVEPCEGGSRFTRVGRFNPRGNVPSFVLNLGKKKLAEFLPKFRAAVAKQYA